MICALSIPAYRQTVNVQTAYAWAQDALTCAELGWRPLLIWTDQSGIARSRNTIVKIASDAGARLLLMCDSDTFPIPMEGGLGAMWSAMSAAKAAVCGAAVAMRNGNRVNCEPSRPGEVYEGEVGTGYMLIDLVALRTLPRPWFVHRDTEDGLRVECGEDISFCRHVKAHGHKVLVHYGMPMGHADQSVARTDQ